MKAKIEVMIRDEQGKVIGQLEAETMDLGCQSLHEIAGYRSGVAECSPKRVCGGEKKLDLKRNGHGRVMVKTLHGQFEFKLQKYLQDGQSVSYFDLTEQLRDGYVSSRLQELSAYYSNRMSYEEVEFLVERVTGERLLSDQSIWQIVNRKAVQVSQQWQRQVETSLSESVGLPDVNVKVDLYDPVGAEILLFEDGIQVKQQKEKRVRRSKSESGLEEIVDEVSKRSRVNTDVVLLQKSNGAFEYLSAGIDNAGNESVSLARIVQTRMIQEYGKEQDALNLVAITDGAKTIRLRLLEIFGVAVTVILDWYHLGKKLRELISMIARNKVEKSTHLRELFQHLWHGQVEEALKYLHNWVQPRNGEKLAELVGYLEKHRTEIIDYERRKQAGRTIGSGRVEKGVDQVIGHRQKQKGTSWRPKGSKALAILKILELNGQWQQTWFPAQTA